jgi:anti-sigma B factor antagonist
MSSLKITDHQVRDVIVLDIDGDLRIGESCIALHNAIGRLLKEGHNQILLNLAGVAYIDSSGLGEIIASHVALNKNGGQIKLIHLTQRVRELMAITKLLTVFDAYEIESEALNSFESPVLELGEYRSPLPKETRHETHP